MAEPTATFSFKKYLLFLIIFAGFLQYVILRIGFNIGNNKNSKLSPATENTSSVKFLSSYYRRPELFNKCALISQRNPPILIKYNPSYSFSDNAVLITKTYRLTLDSLQDIKAIDICSEYIGDDSQCHVSELTDFIRNYFDKSRDVLQYFPAAKCYSPRIFHDFSEEELKALGVMIGLALSHQVYIGKSFCKNISSSQMEYDNDFISYAISLLSEIDPNQHAVASEINSNRYAAAPTYAISLNPNSKNIFLGKTINVQDKIDADGFEIIHLTPSGLPLFQLLKTIFQFKSLEDGLHEVFGHSVVNCPDNRFYRYYGDGQLVFDAIFMPGEDKVELEEWKKHSLLKQPVEGSHEEMFWRVLSTLPATEVPNVFTILTGMKTLPLDHFKRLPRTTIVTVHRRFKFVPDLLSFDKLKFIVYIRADCGCDEIENELKKILNHFENTNNK